MPKRELFLYSSTRESQGVRNARDNAILDGILDPNCSLEKLIVVSEIADFANETDGWWPQIKGLSDEENLQFFPLIPLRQRFDNRILRKIHFSKKI